MGKTHKELTGIAKAVLYGVCSKQAKREVVITSNLDMAVSFARKTASGGYQWVTLECCAKFVLDVKLPASWGIVSILDIAAFMKSGKLLVEKGRVTPIAYNAESVVPCPFQTRGLWRLS